MTTVLMSGERREWRPVRSTSAITAAERWQALPDRTHGEHDHLLAAIHRLEAALASAATCQRAWADRVGDELKPVADVLELHVTSAESPDGLLAETDKVSPRLEYRLEQLRREHAGLRTQLRGLQQQIQHHGDDEKPNCQDIRRRAARMLDALRHHQAQENDLIFGSFFADIGVGD